MNQVHLSFDGEVSQKYDGYYGIAQLSGIIINNESHLHISLFDENGKFLIGHLNKEAIIEEKTHVLIGALN